jgi:hypothetical protein
MTGYVRSPERLLGPRGTRRVLELSDEAYLRHEVGREPGAGGNTLWENASGS